ncbi:MAG: alpha/beta hydrolase [Lachnospiraceae bacterium]|nr:alpha/beta hydrolase [Lachnospiraceae bacterium]
MAGKKLFVIFPGMGYTKDKPLLYYGGKIARNKGYEIIDIDYTHLFTAAKFDAPDVDARIEQSYEMVKDKLATIDFSAYDSVVFAGKSMGTMLSARYAEEYSVKANQLWYTPLEPTFEHGCKSAIAFIGTKDPFSDVARMSETAKAQGIPLHVYEGGNHSLETGDIETDIKTLGDVMKLTEEFLK